MHITWWDLVKAVALAIVQLNAITFAVSITLGPLFQAYDIVRDWLEARNVR